MFLADLHTHTNRSDGRLSLQELVDLYGRRGFGALAVTDHLCEKNSLLGKTARYLGCSLTEENFALHMEEVREEGERAWRQYRMLVIPGFEITKNTFSNHRSAHILALGLSSYIDPGLEIPELCRAIRAAGGLSVAAHPVSTRRLEKQTYHLWDRRHELAPDFDAWEVASGPHLFPEVLHSGLPMLANSDLHCARQIESWKTVFHCERQPEAILQAIRQQELQLYFYQEAPAPAPATFTQLSELFSPFI
jgi:predicted metal-dependent phosphoesterase TrpH